MGASDCLNIKINKIDMGMLIDAIATYFYQTIIEFQKRIIFIGLIEEA